MNGIRAIDRNDDAQERDKMRSQITITCCCCKKQVQLGENPSEISVRLAGWVSIARKPFCGECLALFTEEDWDCCDQPPVPLGLSEVARLIPGEAEPL